MRPGRSSCLQAPPLPFVALAIIWRMNQEMEELSLSSSLFLSFSVTVLSSNKGTHLFFLKHVSHVTHLLARPGCHCPLSPTGQWSEGLLPCCCGLADCGLLCLPDFLPEWALSEAWRHRGRGRMRALASGSSSFCLEAAGFFHTYFTGQSSSLAEFKVRGLCPHGK